MTSPPPGPSARRRATASSSGADPYLVTDTATAPSSTTTWPVTEVKVKVGDTVTKGAVLATAEHRRPQARPRECDQRPQVRTGEPPGGQDRPLGRGGCRRHGADPPGARSASTTRRTRSRRPQDDRDAIKAQIAAATLKAPIDGIVTEVNVDRRLRCAVGRGHRRRLDDVPDHDRRRRERPRRHQGRPGGRRQRRPRSTRTSPARSRRSRRSPAATATPAWSAIRSRSRSRTRRPRPGPGMSADVTITIASATNVLTVPAEALRGTHGRLQRAGPRRGRARRRPTAVDVGLVTNTTAEIKSGLDRG